MKEIELKDYTNDKEVTHFSMSEIGNFAFSDKDKLDDWVEIERHAGVFGQSGEIKDLKQPYKLVNWEIKEGKSRNYDRIN